MRVFCLFNYQSALETGLFFAHKNYTTTVQLLLWKAHLCGNLIHSSIQLEVWQRPSLGPAIENADNQIMVCAPSVGRIYICSLLIYCLILFPKTICKHETP